MSISVACPQCKVSLRVRDDMAGKRGKCPHCKGVVAVPSGEEVITAVVIDDDGPLAVAAARPPQAAGVSRTSAAVAPAAATTSARRAAPPPGRASQPALPSSPPAAQPPAALSPAAQPPAALPPLPTAAQPSHPKAAATAQSPPPMQEIMGCFAGNIAAVPQSLTYKLGVLLVTAVMVLLPLIYVALIGLVGYGVYYHMVNHVGIIGSARGRGAFFTLLIYVAPLVIGTILIVFMIKPLFARPRRDQHRRSLTRGSQPLLFAFVDRICQAVGSPQPRRIDIDCEVNASASFRRGWLSMLGNDLVLTIGMPLAAGLSAQQFAGVLAHEFGHFTQSVGMRLTYIIRSISHWFTRVVYERDAWDEWLSNSTKDLDLRLAWVLYLAQLFVWLTRRVLWVLMMIGHAVGGFMLRQMEFDADRYEARLAGSDTFAATARQLTVLNIASRGAHADLSDFFRDGRLGDNLPKLMMANARQLPPELQTKIDEVIEQSKTGMLDTHPCDKERIENARRENTAGIFHSDRPASDLFHNFDQLATSVTADFYRDAFGRQFKPDEMHSTDDLLARQGREQQANEALARFFQNRFHILRPLSLPADPVTPPQDARQTLTRLQTLRQRMLDAQADYALACTEYDQADTRILQAEQVAALLRADLRVRAADFSVPTKNKDSVTAARAAAVSLQEQLADRLMQFEQAAGGRLYCAVQLLQHPKVADRVPSSFQMRKDCEQLLPALAATGRRFAKLLALRNSHAALAVLCGNLDGNSGDQALIQAIKDTMESIDRILSDLRSALSHVQYPLDHARGQISVATYLLPDVIDSSDLSAIYEASQETLNKLPSLCVRLAARLAMIAEQVETAVGLKPLPQPPAAEPAPAT